MFKIINQPKYITYLPNTEWKYLDNLIQDPYCFSQYLFFLSYFGVALLN